MMIKSSSTVYSCHSSPIGELLLTWDDGALTRLHMGDHRSDDASSPDPRWRRDDSALRKVHDQLRAYFAGELRKFDLPLRMEGTSFQRLVWEGLLEIPYGATASYAELARRIGHPGASRAVGAANARNPIGLIVPCHRVIGANGTLTGYGGGLNRKEWLLRHEASVIGKPYRVRPLQSKVAACSLWE
jgi:methylated-DNA-[protein]-cysteine S-methyltransferase